MRIFKNSCIAIVEINYNIKGYKLRGIIQKKVGIDVKDYVSSLTIAKLVVLFSSWKMGRSLILLITVLCFPQK